MKPASPRAMIATTTAITTVVTDLFISLKRQNLKFSNKFLITINKIRKVCSECVSRHRLITDSNKIFLTRVGNHCLLILCNFYSLSHKVRKPANNKVSLLSQKHQFTGYTLGGKSRNWKPLRFNFLNRPYKHYTTINLQFIRFNSTIGQYQ